MKETVEEKRDDLNPGIILAIPNEWLQIPILDLLSAQREKYTRTHSLEELYSEISESKRPIVVIDIFAYADDYRNILKNLTRHSPHSSIIALVSESKVDLFQPIDSLGSFYIIAKENIDTQLLPAINCAHKDQDMMSSIFDLIREREQLPAFTNEEVNQLKKEIESIFDKDFGRRNFLKGSAAAAAVATVASATASPVNVVKKALAVNNSKQGSQTEVITPLSCRANCFQSCMFNAHVRDGKLVKTSMMRYPEDDYSGCCLRGLSIPQRTYNPNRLKQPLRRVGERGGDQWEAISWDEAIAEVAENFMRVQEQYGDRALAVDTASGCYGLVHGVQGYVNRFSHAVGATRINVCYDQATGYGTNRVIGGGVWLMGNEPADMLRAKAIFIWGSNPVHSQLQNWRIIAKAKRSGAKVICIDPIKTITAYKSDEYVPIVPGTDLLLILSMMRIVVEEDWLDYDYLKYKSTAPYLVRKDNGMMLRKSDFDPDIDPEEDDYYVWDAEADEAVFAKDISNPVIEGSYVVNGVAVDTAYSLLKERIMENELSYTVEKTGISAEKIYELTHLYVHSGASSIYTNYGIDHYENGHLWGTCMAMIGVMTGNVARPGCSIGGLYVNSSITFNYLGMYLEGSTGKVQDNRIPQTYIGTVFREQKLFDEPYPLKAMLTQGSNSISNFAEQNQWFDDILPNLDFWAVIDVEMSDSARYADIVLPAAFWPEVNDLRNNYNNPYLSLSKKAIEPLYDCKSDLEIIELIAHAMGLGEYFPKRTDIDLIKVLLDHDLPRSMGITYERLEKEVSIKTSTRDDQPFVRGVNGWPTATGKAEVYCENPLPRTDFGQDLSEVWERERLPYWKPPNEAWSENPLFKKYPLVYVQEHSRFRTHSQFFDVPMFMELDPDPYTKIAREDAEQRGIRNGDMVEVFNDRGKAVVRAIIDDSIMTGTITIPKGWQRNQFIEGCFQELTNTSSDPMACNFAYFDALVDVRKL